MRAQENVLPLLPGILLDPTSAFGAQSPPPHHPLPGRRAKPRCALIGKALNPVGYHSRKAGVVRLCQRPPKQEASSC
jgi:hypothetical protein